MLKTLSKETLTDLLQDRCWSCSEYILFEDRAEMNELPNKKVVVHKQCKQEIVADAIREQEMDYGEHREEISETLETNNQESKLL